MKVIFLDFDGVMNTFNDKILQDDKLALLAEIVDKTQAKIVLSTSWREHWEKTANVELWESISIVNSASLA